VEQTLRLVDEEEDDATVLVRRTQPLWDSDEVTYNPERNVRKCTPAPLLQDAPAWLATDAERGELLTTKPPRTGPVPRTRPLQWVFPALFLLIGMSTVMTVAAVASVLMGAALAVMQ